MHPVILDMDPGVDDALAIILALRSPELELMGISVLSGNVPLERTAENALKVLELMECAHIPVHVGAERPLVREPVYAFEIHGEHGLGAAELPEPGSVPAGEAVQLLIEGIHSRPGEVMVIASGPLTNLALAEEQEPGVLRQARRIIAMGGALRERGNISPVSEFNFYVDPHAVRRVFESGANLSLLPLDLTRRVGLERARIQELAQRGASPVAAFCAAATQKAVEYEEKTSGYAGMYLHDPLAVAMAVEPRLCSFETLRLDVEVEEGDRVGQVVAAQAQEQGFEVECAVEVDSARFMELFLERVFG